MAEEITTLELLEAFVDFCKDPEHTLRDVVEHYSSAQIVVPSFKRTYRNEEIVEKFRKGASVRELADEYQLCVRTIYEITYEDRNPTLF